MPKVTSLEGQGWNSKASLWVSPLPPTPEPYAVGCLTPLEGILCRSELEFLGGNRKCKKISKKVPQTRHHSLRTCKVCLRGLQRTLLRSLVSSQPVFHRWSHPESCRETPKPPKHIYTKLLHFINVKPTYLFISLFSLFLVNTTNVGLELTTGGSRVTCSTD